MCIGRFRYVCVDFVGFFGYIRVSFVGLFLYFWVCIVDFVTLSLISYIWVTFDIFVSLL